MIRPRTFLNPILLGKQEASKVRPPTLTAHSFAAPLAMMMESSSFESPKPCLLTLYLKNSIGALLTSVMTC